MRLAAIYAKRSFLATAQGVADLVARYCFCIPLVGAVRIPGLMALHGSGFGCGESG